MKYITKEDEVNFKPKGIDYSLAESKGLINNGELNNEYFLLQSIYSNLLEQYINSKINIKSIEEDLDNRGYRSVEDNDKDIYQYISNNKYFYVRNTLYVEKLPMDYIRLLLSKNPEVLSEEYTKLIEDTYKTVITTDSFKLQEFNLSYGPQSSGEYFMPNNSLVFGFRLAEEDASLYPNDDAWFEDYCTRRAYISDLLPKLEQEFSDKLNTKCGILEYFNESVKKKTVDKFMK